MVESDVVDVGIPGGSGAQCADGHESAVAGIGAEGGGEFLEVGTLDIDGGDLLEGGGVSRVGHDTHLERGVVAGACGASPEGELEGGEGNDGSVHGGEHDDLVVAVGAGGGSVVPVEAAAAAGGVVIGGAAGDIGVSEIGGAVVEAAHAVDESRRGAAAGADAFGSLEAHGVRQGVERGAAGAE